MHLKPLRVCATRFVVAFLISIGYVSAYELIIHPTSYEQIDCANCKPNTTTCQLDAKTNLCYRSLGLAALTSDTTFSKVARVGCTETTNNSVNAASNSCWTGFTDDETCRQTTTEYVGLQRRRDDLQAKLNNITDKRIALNRTLSAMVATEYAEIERLQVAIQQLLPEYNATMKQLGERLEAIRARGQEVTRTATQAVGVEQQLIRKGKESEAAANADGSALLTRITAADEELQRSDSNAERVANMGEYVDTAAEKNIKGVMAINRRQLLAS